MRHSLHLRLGGVVAAVILAAFAIQVVAAIPAGATSPGKNGRIAFARALHYGTQPPWVVYSIRADGSGIKKLVSNATSPAWSPDGTLLAYVNYRWDGTPRAIWVMNADGSGRHQLTHPDPGAQTDTSPTWSPDGSRIAFTRPDATGPEMWIVNADGTGLVQVTTDGLTLDAAWAPSGEPDRPYQVELEPNLHGRLGDQRRRDGGTADHASIAAGERALVVPKRTLDRLYGRQGQRQRNPVGRLGDQGRRFRAPTAHALSGQRRALLVSRRQADRVRQWPLRLRKDLDNAN